VNVFSEVRGAGSGGASVLGGGEDGWSRGLVRSFVDFAIEMEAPVVRQGRQRSVRCAGSVGLWPMQVQSSRVSYL